MTGRRGALALGLLAALAAALFAALGAWQLGRRAWKLDLMTRVEARLAAAPVPAPGPGAWTGLDPREAEYRRVEARGVFRHADETLVQAVTERGPGFWVMTPLEVAPREGPGDAFTLLVNRGFVPPDRRDPASRPLGNPAGPERVVGLMRLAEPGGGFLRRNDPAVGRWYSRDVAAIAALRGLPDPAPYFVDADATPHPGGLPVGGLTVVAFRNTHLVYALTWFVLALMALGALAYLVREGRRGPEPPVR